jgi:hypothetical protein
MSDDEISPEPSPYDGTPENRDWFLSAVVDFTNRTGTRFPMTLQAMGATISGTLIGGREWFDCVCEEFAASSAEAEVQADYKEFFGSFGAVYPDPASASEPHIGSAKYIHLRDARIHAPGAPAIPQNRGIFWRGRLDAIAGFAFGVLGPPT